MTRSRIVGRQVASSRGILQVPFRTGWGLVVTCRGVRTNLGDLLSLLHSCPTSLLWPNPTWHKEYLVIIRQTSCACVRVCDNSVWQFMVYYDSLCIVLLHWISWYCVIHREKFNIFAWQHIRYVSEDDNYLPNITVTSFKKSTTIINSSTSSTPWSLCRCRQSALSPLAVVVWYPLSQWRCSPDETRYVAPRTRCW